MFTNTGNLSFYLGIGFILMAFIGLIVTYRLIKRNTIEEEKLEKLIELGKWFIASVAIVVGATIIGDGFKERDQDVKEFAVFDKYVSTITKADGIEERWLLADYFSIVAPDGELRKSWSSYKTSLIEPLEKYRTVKAKLDDLNSKTQPTESEKQEIVKLEAITKVYEQPLIASKSSETISAIAKQTEIRSDVPNQWIIITGGDSTLEAAQFELNKARKINPDSRIYKRGGMYRTVIPNFSSKSAATARLPEIVNEVNAQGAYVRNLRDWCKSIDDSGNYLTCFE